MENTKPMNQTLEELNEELRKESQKSVKMIDISMFVGFVILALIGLPSLINGFSGIEIFGHSISLYDPIPFFNEPTLPMVGLGILALVTILVSCTLLPEYIREMAAMNRESKRNKH